MKNSRLLLILLLVIFFVITGFLFYKFSEEEQTEVTSNPSPTALEQDFSELDIFKEDQIDESKHDLKLSIISPEEESFEPGQARFYKALIEGNFKYNKQIKCKWEYFLNQNNEEALYETMDNKSVLSKESQEICGFTSTFIEDAGVLRVKLTMTVYDNTNEDIETVSAERVYTVVR